MDILWLDDPRCADTRLVGGKAARLSQLAAAFDVPYGFCITAPALAGIDTAADPLPAPLQDAIAAAYHTLASRFAIAAPPVAVRSSAIDEDSAELSFAGLHETLLNVVGAPAVIAAVARCAQSVGNAPVAAYRRRHSLTPAGGVAVLVQLLIEADASAVAFSLDPVSGDQAQIRIDATGGLGEGLVGGRVSPDSYLLRKDDLSIISRDVAAKQQMSEPAAGGAQRVSALPALSDEQIVTVARLARELEQYMGWPVDVECAFAGRRLALLQCRPVTARHPPALPPVIDWGTPADAALTWRWGRQAFPSPLTPLMQSYLPFHTQGWLRDSRAHGTVGEIRIRFFQGYYYSLWQPSGLTTWEEADQHMQAVERAAPERWRQEFLPRLRADHERVRTLNLAPMTDGELAVALQENLTAQVQHFTIHAHMASVPYSAVERLLNWYAARFPQDTEADAYRLLQGLENTSVTSAHELWLLSQQCDEAAAAALKAQNWAGLPVGFAQRWRAYLEAFGHRTHALADPASPTWQESPAPLARLVLSYAGQSIPDPSAERVRLATERAAFTAEVQLRLRPEEREGFAALLATAQANYPLTEDHNFWIDQQSPADLRLLCAELGRRMAERGALAEANDIAYLTLSELVLWGFGLADPLRGRVAERKAEHAIQRRYTPPDYLGQPPEPGPWVDRFGGPVAPLDATAGSLQGVGASAGRGVGPVRVAQSFEDAQLLQAGEVLVCPSTDPSWAPLFAVAAALITDTGGSLCHGAVLAREYRLPAVVGTHVGTTQLWTGQRVEVDGLAGTVRLLDS